MMQTTTGLRPRNEAANALAAKLGELAQRPLPLAELRIEPDADPIDQGCSDANRGMAAVRLNLETAIARDVRDAFRKVDTTRYGLCENCDRPIHPRRLEVMPWARFCVRCQQEMEEQAQSLSLEWVA